VENNPGSFCYDEQQNILYIHPFDGNAPDSILHNFELIRRENCIHVDEKNYIHFEGFLVKHSSNSISAIVLITNSFHITFKNIHIRGGGVTFVNCTNLNIEHVQWIKLFSSVQKEGEDHL
jgi:hypothetical protein